MKNVEYELNNFIDCKCPECPVQKDSKCAKDLLDHMAGVEKLDTEIVSKKLLPQPVMSPGLYCSDRVDGSTCDDLDYEKACICPTCKVWHHQTLGANYYCQNGSAAKIEG